MGDQLVQTPLSAEGKTNTKVCAGRYFTMSRNVLTFLSRSPNGKKSKLNREERNNKKTNYGCIDKLKEKVSDAKRDKLSDFAMRRTRKCQNDTFCQTENKSANLRLK